MEKINILYTFYSAENNISKISQNGLHFIYFFFGSHLSFLTKIVIIYNTKGIKTTYIYNYLSIYFANYLWWSEFIQGRSAVPSFSSRLKLIKGDNFQNILHEGDITSVLNNVTTEHNARTTLYVVFRKRFLYRFFSRHLYVIEMKWIWGICQILYEYTISSLYQLIKVITKINNSFFILTTSELKTDRIQ